MRDLVDSRENRGRRCGFDLTRRIFSITIKYSQRYLISTLMAYLLSQINEKATDPVSRHFTSHNYCLNSVN